MQIKHEWRKKEKQVYLPKKKPEVITIPAYQFITVKGVGNPNSKEFSKYIEALYSVAYAIKMTLKKVKNPPKNYIDWTVYPLEGVWDISEKAKQNFNGVIDKNELVFELMLRQPDFVTIDFFNEMLALTKKKKSNPFLETLEFKKIKEGNCIQMLHVGSYDNEATTFTKMETFATAKNLIRKSKIHREIYLSDFRKVSEEKLKTVLRFQIEN